MGSVDVSLKGFAIENLLLKSRPKGFCCCNFFLMCQLRNDIIGMYYFFLNNVIIVIFYKINVINNSK